MPAADAGSLHAICAARLAAAERVPDPHAVLFSGAARHGGPSSEAELMRAAWHGADVPLDVDTSARTTAGNAAGVAALARELGARLVVVVTSWEQRIARGRVWAAWQGCGARVRSAPAARARSVRTGGARGVRGGPAGHDGARAAGRAAGVARRALRPQVAQHSQHAAVVGGGRQLELAEDAAHVLLDPCAR